MKLAPFYLIAVALIGFANALYLSYFAYTGTFPSCTIGGCTAVLTSTYSKFLDIPLAYWGVAYYLGMLIVAGLLAYAPFSKNIKRLAFAYAGIGLLCSAAFVYIQSVLIGSFCQYCLISAAATVLLFGIAAWHYYSNRG